MNGVTEIFIFMALVVLAAKLSDICCELKDICLTLKNNKISTSYKKEENE